MPERTPSEQAPEHAYLTVQRRGVLTLPAGLRRRHHLDRPGAQVEVTERQDGVIELRPHIAVPAEDAWFWTKEWQEGEREASAELAAGKATYFGSTEEFLAALDANRR